jgi:Rap1a immunity proteins
MVCSRASNGDSITLEQMKQRCEELESYWQRDPPKVASLLTSLIKPMRERVLVICQPIADLSHLLEGPGCTGPEPAFAPNCRHTLNICVPKNATINQALTVFLTYARSHPAQWHEAGWVHFLNSLTTAFPCKRRRRSVTLSRNEPLHGGQSKGLANALLFNQIGTSRPKPWRESCPQAARAGAY